MPAYTFGQLSLKVNLEIDTIIEILASIDLIIQIFTVR